MQQETPPRSSSAASSNAQKLHAFPLPWRVADDVVDADDLLGGLGSGTQLGQLRPVALENSMLLHVRHALRVHVDAGGGATWCTDRHLLTTRDEVVFVTMQEIPT